MAPATDPAHCGGCGLACSTSNVARACAAGSCQAGTCNAGFADCNTDKRSDGCEIGIFTDADNCGGCGTICSGANMASRTCGNVAGAGTCNGTCSAGFADCNGNKLADGCEVNLNLDVAHCGGCAAAC